MVITSRAPSFFLAILGKVCYFEGVIKSVWIIGNQFVGNCLIYFRNFLWWDANISHNPVNRIQLNRINFIAICQKNFCSFPLERGMDCRVFVSWDALCTVVGVYTVQAGEARADVPLCSRDDPLQRFPPTQGDTAAPCCDSAATDVASAADLGEGLTFGCGHLEQLHEDQPLLKKKKKKAPFTVVAGAFWPRWVSEGPRKLVKVVKHPLPVDQSGSFLSLLPSTSPTVSSAYLMLLS